MANPPQLPPHQLGPPVEFKASGEDATQTQANLIMARNNPAFPFVKEMFADAMVKRAEQIMLDYTAQAVGVRYEVDGLWHNITQRDRQSGDAMLVVMKKLADLNVNERRAKQSGKFKVQFQDTKLDCSITSQGVQTGERVLLKLSGWDIKLDILSDLGMREKMVEQVKSLLNREEGTMLIVSAMPGDGLTTSFCATLSTSDRFMRDFVGAEDKQNPLPSIENVNMRQFDAAAGETPVALLNSILLKEPDALVVPDLVNAETIDLLCDQVIEKDLFVTTHIPAKEGVEALLRVLAMKPAAEKFSQAVSAVIYGRLVRKLCETCRQPYQPTPQLLQQLGLPAGRISTLFREYQPPPPEQCVDAKGNPIPPPVCPNCGNMAYQGRTAVFELIVVDDKMREALIKSPKLDVLRNLVRASGQRTIKEEGIALVARGVTSLTEMQRVLQK